MPIQQSDDCVGIDEPNCPRFQSHNRRWIPGTGEHADFVENLARAYEPEGLLASFGGHPDSFEPTFSDHVETGAGLAFQKHDLVGFVLTPHSDLDHGIQCGLIQCAEVRHGRKYVICRAVNPVSDGRLPLFALYPQGFSFPIERLGQNVQDSGQSGSR